MVDHRPPQWPPPVYDHPLPQLLHDIGAGRAKLPEATGRRHHFVPKFVLRGFMCPKKPDHTVQLVKATGKTRMVSVTSALWEDRLYAGEAPDRDHESRIEALLSVIEGSAAPALQRLLDGNASSSEDESFPISLLFGLQLSRTPGTLQDVGDLAERLGQDELMRTLNDPVAFAAMLSHTRGTPLTPTDAQRVRQQHIEAFGKGVELRLDKKRNVGLNAMVGSMIEAGLAVAHADWWILHPHRGAFVLNDRGFARFDASDALPLTRGLLFPLRSDACLLVAPPTSDATQVYRAAVSTAQLDRINLRTYGWAEAFLFGHTQNVLGYVRKDAKREPRRARPPTRQERLPGPP